MARANRRYTASEALSIILAESDDDDEPLDNILDGDDDSDHNDADEDIDVFIENVDDNVLAVDNLVELNEAQSSDDEDNDNYTVNNGFFAPSGIRWVEIHGEKSNSKVSAVNIIRDKPGPKSYVNPSSPLQSFDIFAADIIEEATRFTNLEGRRVVALYNHAYSSRKIWYPCNNDEIRAFIGLHILAGAYKSHHRDVKSLWDMRDGYPSFRATMSRERFYQIKRCFRFDDRVKRDKEDPLSPVRYIWNLFNQRLSEPYNPKPFLTIDEQLLEYHGRVRFRQYIATKPGKYGIKIFWVNEAESGYALHGCVYIGETTLSASERHGMSVPEAVTLKVCKPFLEKGYNITSDNWFTSLPLAKNLLSHRTTLVGTIRSNRRDLPAAAKVTTGRIKKSCKFYKHESTILASYWDKGAKPVLLLSTFHQHASVNETALPEIVATYNNTKSGTDNMDHMLRLYTSRRKCCRWTYGFYFNLIDIALLNAYIVYRHNNVLSHYSYLVDVGYALLDPHIRASRINNKFLTCAAKSALQLLGYKPIIAVADVLAPKRSRCYKCPREKDKKTTQTCAICKRFVCSDHSAKKCICENC